MGLSRNNGLGLGRLGSVGLGRKLDGSTGGGSPPVPSIDPDAKAYLDGYAPAASQTFKTALNDYIVGLKADAIWSRLDWLLIPADTSVGSLRNVRNLAKFATALNSPVFTAYRGFMGDGIGAHIDLNEALATMTNLFSQNDAMVGIHINVQANANNVAVLGNVGSTRRHMIQVRQSAAGNTAMQLSSGSGTGVYETNPATKLGHKTLVRSDANNLKGFNNGALVSTQANGSTGTIGQDNGCLLRSTTSYSPDRYSLFYSGGGISDALVAKLHTRNLAFLTAIGAQ